MPHPLLNPTTSRLALSLLFVWGGVMHFRAPQIYLPFMPPYLPFPLELIYVSGIAEIAGGIGIWPRQTRKWAGIGLIALLIAVFPANIDMALEGTENVGILLPRWLWWVRLPFQPLLIWWVWAATLQKETL
jgi:uncharacterized membrane protein